MTGKHMWLAAPFCKGITADTETTPADRTAKSWSAPSWWPLGLLVLLGSLSQGCAWQDTVYQASQTPKYLGLQNHIQVLHSPRWTLPVGSAVAFTEPQPQAVPAAWHDAAQRGMARMFTVTAPAQIYLAVHWPAEQSQQVLQAQSNKAQQGFFSGMGQRLGISQLLTPGTQREKLWVSVHSVDGSYSEKLALKIHPRVWGQDWHDEDIIEAGFAQLAESLAGR